MRFVAFALAACFAGPAGAQGSAWGAFPPPRGAGGDAPIAAAGSQAARLEPGEGSAWRGALAVGMGGRFGGVRARSDAENPGVALTLGGQADAAWPERHGQAARLRLRLVTGAEGAMYVPSDGDAEAAYLIGRPELRFVLGRIELARHPGLAVQLLAQGATLPSVEGSIPLLAGAMRIAYALAPVEAAWVLYRGGAHVPHAAGWPTESDRPGAATAARLRATALLPALELSVQSDVVKMWRGADLLLSMEGSVGYQALERSALLAVGLRWDDYVRRGVLPNTKASDSQVLLFVAATLAL